MSRIAEDLTSTLTAPPLKTNQGKEELSQRTRRLSQRHRTMLLLIDGRRSRELVLEMAAQAGVPAAFFDELVTMGLVECPDEPAQTAAPADTTAREAEPSGSRAAGVGEARSDRDADSTLTGPGAPDFDGRQGPGPMVPAARPAQVAHRSEAVPSAPMPWAESTVSPRREPAMAQASVTSAAAPRPPEPAPKPIAPATRPAPDRPRVSAPAPLLSTPDWMPVASAPVPLGDGPRSDATARTARVRFAAAQYPAAPSVVPGSIGPAPPAEPVAREAPLAAAPVEMPAATLGATPGAPTLSSPEPAADAPPTGDDELSAEDRVLAEVRGLLIGTLLVDAPVSTSLTALRVGRARSHGELVALVWEIERALARAQVPREGLPRLMKARELLALGNTLVHEDTDPGRTFG